MLKGIFRAGSGMIPQVRKQEITANNLANANTAGFKKDAVFLEKLSEAERKLSPRKSDWETPMIDQVYTDFSQGTFVNTSGELDAAIKGDGFFVLESPTGDQRLYTRNGNFALDQEGFLVNNEGFRVLSDAGPIAVSGNKLTISDSGQVVVDGNTAGILQVVDFPDYQQLEKTGESSFLAPEEIEPLPARDYRIQQGFLEQSNINIVKEMVGMIIAMRHYETNSKAIHAQNESLTVLFNQVGKTQM